MPSDNGVMRVRLSSYLRRLRAIEKRKPREQRLSVPTVSDLSGIVGITRTNMSRIVNGHTRSLNLDIAATIITEMRKRGFATEIADILKYEPPEYLKSKPVTADDPWAPPPPPLTRRQRQKYPGEAFVRAYEEYSSSDEASGA